MEFFILSILQSFVFLQAAQLFNGCVKNLSDPVSKHQRGTVLLLFNRNDGSGGDADQTGKLLLGQTRGCPQFFYLGSDFPTSLRNMKYASCEVNFILSQPRRFVNEKKRFIVSQASGVAVWEQRPPALQKNVRMLH